MRFPKETERLGMAALLLNKIQNDPDDLSAVRGPTELPAEASHHCRAPNQVAEEGQGQDALFET